MTELLGGREPAGGSKSTASDDGRVAELQTQLKRLAVPRVMLERLFAFAPVGLQLYDANGRSLLTNAAFVEMFGIAPPPEYNVMEDEIAERNGVLGLIRRAFAGETVRVPPVWYDPRELTRVKITQGRRVAIDSLFFPVFDADGRVTHVGVVVQDVSAVLLAREEVEAERDLLRALVEQSGDGIIVADAGGMLRLFNPEAARQHGRGYARVGAEQWAETYGLEDEEGRPLPLETTPLWRAMHGATVTDARWVVRRPDGSRRLLVGTATPLLRPDGSPRGAMIITRDETERRRADEERRIALFKDRVIGILGHDLRVPLTSIRAAADALARKQDAPEAELRASVERLVERIDRSADRMSRMIAEVLDFTRARVGDGIPVVRRPADLGAVALAVVEELRAGHPDRDLRLETRGALAGSWDADRLAQVVQNLLGNALVHGEEQRPVRVVVDGSGPDVELSVHNEGPPIPAQTLERIFDPFRRGAAPHGRDEGLGLGLFIVRSIIEAHGGRIDVRSAAPAGTTFTVRLPRGPPPA